MEQLTAPADLGEYCRRIEDHLTRTNAGHLVRIVGPGFQEVARKHASRTDAVAYLSAKIKAGGSGVWGAIPMPEQALSDADARAIAEWLAAGAAP